MASLGNGRAEIGNLLVQPWDLASSATRASFSIYLGGEFTACQTGDAWAAYCGLARDWNGQMSVWILSQKEGCFIDGSRKKKQPLGNCFVVFSPSVLGFCLEKQF